MEIYGDDNIIAVLKAKHINITQPRIQVLKIICNFPEKVFCAKTFLMNDKPVNRISLHRALGVFVKSNILYKVPNTKGIMEYMIHDDFKSNREAYNLNK